MPLMRGDMPLVMPDGDAHVDRCGLPALKPRRDGICAKPVVDRIKVTTADNDDDYNYEYSSEFRAIGSGWPVMVGRCQDHKDLHAREFDAERVRIEKRQTQQAVSAAKIHETKAAYEAAIADYPGTWREE